MREKILEIAGKELEIDPADLEIVDGEVIAKGSPQTKISVPDVAAAATWGHGELITGTGRAAEAVRDDRRPGDGSGRPATALCRLVRRGRRGGRGRRRDRRGDGDPARPVYDVGRAMNPTLVEGQIEGGAMMGLGLGVLEDCYPYYPSADHRGGEFGSYLAPGIEDLPQIDTIIIENPSVRRPVRREGDRRDGEQRAATGDRGGGVRRGRRLGDGAADHPREGAARARGEGRGGAPRREGKHVVFDEGLSVNAVSNGGIRFEVPA